MGTRVMMPAPRAPVEAIAAAFNITLPETQQLPPSYTSLRMWLTRRIATLEGKHKQAWRVLKEDPKRLQRARAANRERVRAYRSRQRAQRASHVRTDSVT
jgi:hypothetical protein